MWGTSYSGFNSLQLACERPPALKAICAIYATDDRWTDDVHWRGGALQLVDLVDYCHYMTPMCVLPPVPAVWGDGWREEWRTAAARPNEPWLLTWLRENRDGPYWRHGSVRLGPEGGGYDRIDCPVMIVAGWADGYRNNSFRTVAALRRGGRAAPAAGRAVGARRPDDRDARPADRPRRRDGRVVRPLAARHRARRTRTAWTSSSAARPSRRPTSTSTRALGPRRVALPRQRCRRPRRWTGRARSPVDPDTGTAAWIDCAGHLPWGQSGDQREDDARSLTWEWDADGEVLVGHPRVRLRVSADAPAASLSVKLCDVFPDGTSALITRGTLDLAFRDGVHGRRRRRRSCPGEEYDVVLELDACAYEPAPGQRLRLSVAGADWPNTVAPPAPVTLTVHGGTLELPLWRWHRPGRRVVHARRAALAARTRPASRGRSAATCSRRTTTCAVRHGSTYDVPHDGTRDRAVRRRGDRRPAHLRPAGHGRVQLHPRLARRRGARALDAAGRHRRPTATTW